MPSTTKSIIVLALFLIAAAPRPVAAQSVELGLTPSPVYSLWVNINKAALTYARARSIDEDWLGELGQMKPGKFSGKIPANVLEMVKRFNIRLDMLDVSGTVNPTKKLLEGDLPQLLASEGNRVTPSLVYLHSGHVLVDIAGDILETSATPPEISPFFAVRRYTGKTPSDVFGLVDLALRRLDKILVRQKAGKLTRYTGSQ
jgi:hypothetical protein